MDLFLNFIFDSQYLDLWLKRRLKVEANGILNLPGFAIKRLFQFIEI